MALFYSTPGDLMLAKIVGPAVVVLFLRRQTAVKSALNLALFYASGAVAVFTFTVIAGGSTADGPREWIAAVVASDLAIVIDLLVLDADPELVHRGEHQARSARIVAGGRDGSSELDDRHRRRSDASTRRDRSASRCLALASR